MRKMRSSRPATLFVALYIGIAAYCLLSVVAGPAGFFAYRELEARREVMVRNMESLGSTNEALRTELDSLRSDPARAGREARALGYLAPGETALVVAGDDRSRGQRRLEPGSVIKAKAPVPLSDALIKELSILAGLMSLGVSLAPGLKTRRPGIREKHQANLF